MDFTFSVLRELLGAIPDAGYSFHAVNGFVAGDGFERGKRLILRHDVDKNPIQSLKVAQLEARLGIYGTYYFRITPGSYNSGIIREIYSLGHEIGYHYEDLSVAGKTVMGNSTLVWRKQDQQEKEKILSDEAFRSFSSNLAKLRKIAPVSTICMHGSPLSRYDSRLIWKYHNYSELNIAAEPYFDIPLDEMLYLTDTGRRWDGSEVSVRDRTYARDELFYTEWERKPVKGSAMMMTEKGCALQKQFTFRTTDEILEAVRTRRFPDRIMLTLHPQRWSDNSFGWTIELVGQTIKNQMKYLYNRYTG